MIRIIEVYFIILFIELWRVCGGLWRVVEGLWRVVDSWCSFINREKKKSLASLETPPNLASLEHPPPNLASFDTLPN
jgi:hypothetical protein